MALRERLLQNAVDAAQTGRHARSIVLLAGTGRASSAISALLATIIGDAPGPVRAHEGARPLEIRSRRGDLRTLPVICRLRPAPRRARWMFKRQGWFTPDFAPDFASCLPLVRESVHMFLGAFRSKRIRQANPPLKASVSGPPQPDAFLLLSLAASRGPDCARKRAARWRVALWPGRTDRLIISPARLRTADATRAAEIYAWPLCVRADLTCHASRLRLEPPRRLGVVACSASAGCGHLRAAYTALTPPMPRSLVDDWISIHPAQAPDRPPAPTCWRVASISLLSQAPLFLCDTTANLPALSARLTRASAICAILFWYSRRRGRGCKGLIALCYALALPRNQAAHIPPPAQHVRRIAAGNPARLRHSRASASTLIELRRPVAARQTFAAATSRRRGAVERIDRMCRCCSSPSGDGSFAL